MKPSSERLGFGEKLGFGLGDTASNLYLQFFGLFLLYYYTDVFGISPAAVATMMIVTRVIDAVSDPLMGIVADRTRSRWGRYRGYLLWMAVPYGLLGYALFHGPELTPGWKLVYAYLTYSLVMLAYTAINVPYSALMGVISPSARERTSVATYRFFCAAFASLAISSLVTPLKNYLGGGDEVLGFRLTMGLFAVLSVFLFWITFATTKERIDPLPQESDIRTDLGSLLRNVSWLILVANAIIIMVGFLIRLSTSVYFLKYVHGDDGGALLGPLDATALYFTCGSIGQILGVLATPVLVRYADKRNLMLALPTLTAVVLFVLYGVPPGSLPLIVGLHTLTMFMFGPMVVLVFSMYTDCAEFSEWRTGRQVTALVVSASIFALKFGSAVGAALPGYVLSAVGFVANAEQNAATIEAMRLMFTVVPGVFFLAGGLLFLFYGLDRTRMKRIEADLRERRRAR